MNIRCSSLPLAWNCASSLEAPAAGEALINQSSEPAELGNAVHRYLAAHVAGTELDIGQLATEHGCDPDELGFLSAQGRKLLKELGKYIDLSKAESEVPMSVNIGDEITITGTGDLCDRQGDTALAVDYKSGRADFDHTAQLRGYGLLLLHKYGSAVRKVTTIVARLREGIWDVEHLTREQLESWRDEFKRRLRNGKGKFNPGGHCEYCPRSRNCPGKQEMAKAAIAEANAVGMAVVAWTPETRLAAGPKIAETLGKFRVITDIAERFREAVKADVLEHGPLPAGPGRQLAILTVNKRVLNPAKARPVLLGKYADQAAIDAATTLSLSKLEASLAAASAHGLAAANKREMNAALEAAGAISTNEVKQLRETKSN